MFFYLWRTVSVPSFPVLWTCKDNFAFNYLKKYSLRCGEMTYVYNPMTFCILFFKINALNVIFLLF